MAKSEERSNEENKNNPEGRIVLGVFIHCEGCGNEVRKCLRGYQGVEGIEINAKNHKVTVKGKKADPIKVAERLRKKTGKHVELISPKPKKEDKKEENKPEKNELAKCNKSFGFIWYIMYVNGIGVQTVDPDMGKNLVSVKGTMHPQQLVEFISRRGGRHAEIVKQTNKGENEKKNEKCSCHNYPSELVYAPQLFSDENPNSCSLM
ncbi:hypothetical protein BUALT_Bualt17G0015300 [Buddleja alternifolia]|uniref:HMA domain-containing protein n=1 Tax=Buddleja alternifolia TaxID=168488 RepID=A0AAV6WAW1_9LAMI|nr:hypothetical protein BUALT_Bualt17G0015300 [Buddleja alternifolia]